MLAKIGGEFLSVQARRASILETAPSPTPNPLFARITDFESIIGIAPRTVPALMVNARRKPSRVRGLEATPQPLIARGGF